MPPRKKRPSEAMDDIAPTRRSTRARKPSKAAAEANEGPNGTDATARKTIIRDSKSLNHENQEETCITVAHQDEIVVHRPKEISDTPLPAVVATTSNVVASAPSVGGKDDGNHGKNEETSIGCGEKGNPAPNSMQPLHHLNHDGIKAADPDVKRDEESEDKIVAPHPDSPKATTHTPIKIVKKTRQYQKAGSVDEGDDLATEQPAIKIVKVSESGRKSRSKYDNPEEMLTNPRSPLVKARLRDLLCSAKAWDLLNPEERKRVLAKLPDRQDILGEDGSDDAKPDVAALRNNDNFRHDAARYQANIASGKHDPEWIRQAQDAHRKRELGMYDEYLATRFEEDWGVKMPGGSGNDVGSDTGDGLTASAGNGDGNSNDNGGGSRNDTKAVSPIPKADVEGDGKKEKGDCPVAPSDDQKQQPDVANASDIRHSQANEPEEVKKAVNKEGDQEMAGVLEVEETHPVADAEHPDKAAATVNGGAAVYDPKKIEEVSEVQPDSVADVPQPRLEEQHMPTVGEGVV